MVVSEPQGRSTALQVLRDAIKLYEAEKDRLKGLPAAPARKPVKKAKRR